MAEASSKVSETAGRTKATARSRSKAAPAAQRPKATPATGRSGAVSATSRSKSAQLEPGDKASFTPRILVFACNWCSYAGADTAGIGRLQQSPNFRLLRVMCSGRVHPAFVLRAFAQGADAVMVSGCHPGDCHYMFGNYRAQEQFEKTRALVDLLGLEPGRLRLEWISAAEGPRFARLMNEFEEQVQRLGPSPLAPPAVGMEAAGGPGAGEDAEAPATGATLLSDVRAFSCLECGRCTAICPVARYQRFSPRRLISRMLSSGIAALAQDISLWACLTCNRCELVCPTGVDYDAFILGLRAAATDYIGVRASAMEHAGDPGAAAARSEGPVGGGTEGDTEARAAFDQKAVQVPCSHGGVFEQIARMMSRPGLRQNRLAWLTPELELKTDKGQDLLYTGCSPYFAAYFGGDTAEGLIGGMRGAVALLNRCGIRPTLLSNERCCGYHRRISGDVRLAEALEQQVIEQIQASGAQRVITICPECLIGLRGAFSRRGISADIVHLSQVLAARSETLAPAAGNGAAGEGTTKEATAETVTFQDPCRLGRYAHLYDAPRRLLTEVAGSALAEMAHNRERATCCGNTAWLHCNAATRSLQLARLEEAKDTGSRRLVTACPGCFIHLRCAQEGLEDATAGEIEIVDLWTYLVQALDGRTSAAPESPDGGQDAHSRKRRKTKR